MIISSIFFYFFSSIAIIASSMVVFAKNSVHSVLWLVLVFCNVAGLFILIGAEFISMIMIIVYVGAVAILFLFMVMMLNLDSNQDRRQIINYLPITLCIGAILLIELFVFIITNNFGPEIKSIIANDNNLPLGIMTIGEVMYYDYIYYFQITGIILLISMIGAISLTHNYNDQVMRQNINSQISKKRTITLKKVGFRERGYHDIN